MTIVISERKVHHQFQIMSRILCVNVFILPFQEKKQEISWIIRGEKAKVSSVDKNDLLCCL